MGGLAGLSAFLDVLPLSNSKAQPTDAVPKVVFEGVLSEVVAPLALIFESDARRCGQRRVAPHRQGLFDLAAPTRRHERPKRHHQTGGVRPVQGPGEVRLTPWPRAARIDASAEHFLKALKRLALHLGGRDSARRSGERETTLALQKPSRPSDIAIRQH